MILLTVFATVSLFCGNSYAWPGVYYVDEHGNVCSYDFSEVSCRTASEKWRGKYGLNVILDRSREGIPNINDVAADLPGNRDGDGEPLVDAIAVYSERPAGDPTIIVILMHNPEKLSRPGYMNQTVTFVKSQHGSDVIRKALIKSYEVKEQIRLPAAYHKNIASQIGLKIPTAVAFSDETIDQFGKVQK